MATFDALVQAVLALPEDQRAEIADRLLESLPTEVTSRLHPAWKAELKRRAARVDPVVAPRAE